MSFFSVFWVSKNQKPKNQKFQGRSGQEPLKLNFWSLVFRKTKNQNLTFGFWFFRKTKTTKPKLWSQIFCFLVFDFSKNQKPKPNFWFLVLGPWLVDPETFVFLVFRQTKNQNLDFGFCLWPVGPIFFVFWVLFLLCGLLALKLCFLVFDFVLWVVIPSLF